MPALTKEQWHEVRTDWEDGLSLDKVARKYGVSVTSVRAHKEKEGWVRKGDPIAAPDAPDTVPAAIFPEVQAAEEDNALIAELRAKLAEAEEREQTLAAQVGQLAKDIKMTLPSTVEELIDYMGREHIEFIALNRFNRERRNQGFNPVELQSGEPLLEREVLKTAAQFLKRQKSWSGESNLRTVKMARPNPESPTGYDIRAIPWEPTINQPVSGPEGARFALNRYLLKGFKIISPQLCHRGPCYAKAAIENGKLLYDGYCSPEHRADDPFLNSAARKGVTTTANAMVTGANLEAAVR